MPQPTPDHYSFIEKLKRSGLAEGSAEMPCVLHSRRQIRRRIFKITNNLNTILIISLTGTRSWNESGRPEMIVRCIRFARIRALSACISSTQNTG